MPLPGRTRTTACWRACTSCTNAQVFFLASFLWSLLLGVSVFVVDFLFPAVSVLCAPGLCCPLSFLCHLPLFFRNHILCRVQAIARLISSRRNSLAVLLSCAANVLLKSNLSSYRSLVCLALMSLSLSLFAFSNMLLTHTCQTTNTTKESNSRLPRYQRRHFLRSEREEGPEEGQGG